MTKEEFGNLVGSFTWNYNCKFLIETSEGNFVWSDPDYPFGDNSVTSFKGTYEDWLKQEQIPCGRDKGKHIIKSYIGNDFTFKE